MSNTLRELKVDNNVPESKLYEQTAWPLSERTFVIE